MAYTAQITYPIYDLNATLFQEVVREVLQAELVKQRTTFSKTFLPQLVKTDEYLTNQISEADLNPAFCSVVKAKTDGTDQQFTGQQNNLNYYIISVYAFGLDNLRKITDALYIILNDEVIKQYFFLYQNTNGDNVISDSGKYKVNNLSTEIEVKETTNNKDVIYGSLILQAEIAEVTQLNTFADFDSIEVTHQLGENETELIQITS